MVTAIGNSPATKTIPSTIKIVDCSSGNEISGGDWNNNQIFTEVTVGTTTDIELAPFTFSKADCGANDYTFSIIGTDASIYDTNKVRFTSNSEATLSFSLVVTAIGDTPATQTIPSIIKIVDCSSGNVISGGSWNSNQLFTELTGDTTSD